MNKRTQKQKATFIVLHLFLDICLNKNVICNESVTHNTDVEIVYTLCEHTVTTLNSYCSCRITELMYHAF